MELRDALAEAPRPVGLVTTMGWLHDGHRALIRRARQDNATTVVTIFVNPRQFNDASDYTRYPRNEKHDLAIIESEGADLVFAPDVPEIYPDGLAMSSRNVHLSPDERAAAAVLRRALLAARDAWSAGERSADALRQTM